jgi:N-methylhydantoinase B
MSDVLETEATQVADNPFADAAWDGKTVSYAPASDWRDRVSADLAFHEEADETVDPVTFEVIRNRLWTTNIAHGEQVTRVSGSPVFASLDFNMSILTEDGEIVQNAPFIQFLNSGAPFGVKYLLENLSAEPGIEDGDVWLLNDPWIAAVHEMDVLFLRPVFVDGKLFGWVSNAGHQYDLGGTVPGGWPQNAVDVFHDPTIFTPMKIMSGNRLRKDLEAMYLRNSRMPDMVALDLRAQLSGCLFAAERLLELCDQFGAATVKAAMRRIIDNAQASFQRKLRRIPDGTWSEVRFLDHKLPGDRHTYRMQVNLTKTDDRIRIDNRGTAPQSDEGPLGFPFTAAVGSVTGVMSVAMVFEQLFSVGGASRQLDYDFEPGLISCSNHPSAVSAGLINAIAHLNAVQQCVSRMLATDPELIEDGVASTPDFAVPVIAGVNDAGEPYGQAMLDVYGAGSGARSFSDGVNTSGPTWSPLTFLLSVESVEQWYPLLYLYRRELIDSGGAGRWRGGVGYCFAWTPYKAQSMALVDFSGGMANSSFSAGGLFGGYPSPACRLVVAKDTDVLEQFAGQRMPTSLDELRSGEHVYLSGKANAVAMTKDDVCEGWTCGGGGFGDPLHREPDRVARDVVDEYISPESARDVYGVVMDAGGRVDEEATDRLRDEIREQRGTWPDAPADGYGTSTPATGAPSRSVHRYLEARDASGRRVLGCTECDAEICDAADDYKAHLLMDTTTIDAVPGGPGVPPSHFIDEPVEFRRYCCPSCHVLMCTEVMIEGEPVTPEMRLVGATA